MCQALCCHGDYRNRSPLGLCGPWLACLACPKFPLFPRVPCALVFSSFPVWPHIHRDGHTLRALVMVRLWFDLSCLKATSRGTTPDTRTPDVSGPVLCGFSLDAFTHLCLSATHVCALNIQMAELCLASGEMFPISLVCSSLPGRINALWLFDFFFNPAHAVKTRKELCYIEKWVRYFISSFSFIWNYYWCNKQSNLQYWIWNYLILTDV